MRNHLRAHPEKGVDSKFRQFALVSESKKNAETYLRRKLAEQEELRGVMARSLGKLPGPHLDPYIARSLDFQRNPQAVVMVDNQYLKMTGSIYRAMLSKIHPDIRKDRQADIRDHIKAKSKIDINRVNPINIRKKSVLKFD